MNKLTAFLIGFMVVMSCLNANAEMYVSKIGDPQFIEHELENGKSISYWETRVLISTSTHESGVVSEENIVIEKDEPLTSNTETEDVLISITWESGYVSQGYDSEVYKNGK